jgi:tetratricopeptide (TPR) repeat protein
VLPRSRPGPKRLRRAVIATLVVTATISARLVSAAQSEIWVPASQIHAIKNQFVAAVSQLAEALAGTYGDEGRSLSAAIESLDRVRLQWDDAIRVYERMLAGVTESAEVHVALGTVYLDRHRIDDALREFAAAGRLDPRRADVYSLSALAHGLASRHKEAAQALIDASSRDRGNPLTFYALGLQLINSGQRDRARDALRTFQELQQKRSSDRDGKSGTPAPFERASLLRQAAGVAPIFPLHRYRQAFARLSEGNYEEAVAEFKRAAIGDPLVADSTANGRAVEEAGALLRRGQLPLALSRLEAALTVAPNRSEAHRVLGVAYWADGQYEKSVAQLNAAIRLVPDDERSRTALADLLVDIGRLAEAEQALSATVQAIPDSGPAHYRLGQLYQIQSLLPAAVRELETAVALNPLVGLDRLYETIGGLYVNQANFDSAVDAYVKRVDVNPNSADAHRKLGEIYFLQGHDDEALAEFAAALLIDPTSSGALAAACQVYVRMGRFAEALDTSRRALALDAAHNEARYALATSLLRLGQADEGKKQLEIFQRTQSAAMADAQRQSALKATLREATLRLGSGEYLAAVALLRQALAGDPNAAGVQRELGIALMKSAQYAEAIQALEKALQWEDGAEVHQLLADAYRALDRPGDSAAHTAMSAQAIARAKEARLRRIGAGR